jgi:threonyl-tRNA synthetase
MRKFDTCFFERYAKTTLETVLGEDFADLMNMDRPDLQKPDKSLGIEVTRAMESSKEVAKELLKEMAGIEVPDNEKEDVGNIIRSGYGYGLQDGKYIGHLEYEYWTLAQPLRRIIENKVSKVASGFYGEFDEYGLYIFCKDNLSEEEVVLTMEYTNDLQRHLDVKYSKMYLSLIDRLYVCELSDADRTIHRATCTSYQITRDMCRTFFFRSLQ